MIQMVKMTDDPENIDDDDDDGMTMNDSVSRASGHWGNVWVHNLDGSVRP